MLNKHARYFSRSLNQLLINPTYDNIVFDNNKSIFMLPPLRSMKEVYKSEGGVL